MLLISKPENKHNKNQVFQIARVLVSKHRFLVNTDYHFDGIPHSRFLWSAGIVHSMFYLPRNHQLCAEFVQKLKITHTLGGYQECNVVIFVPKIGCDLH